MRHLRGAPCAGIALLLTLAVLGSACLTGRSPGPVIVGAIYPLSGPQAEGGRQELAGLRAALEVAGRRGQLGGRDVRLRVEPVETAAGARAAVDRLVGRDHVSVIAGTYGSTLSEAASTQAEQRRTVYWETGAVADLVTQQRRYVFRTVATGSTLGRAAVDFTAEQLLPAAGLLPAQAKAVIVNVDDIYGRSVADSEAALAGAAGISVVDRIQYDPRAFDAAAAAARLTADRPDFLWDVSYIEDGIALWQAIRAAGVPLRAAVGTSSAWCMAEFGHRLGADAIGVYAADKPDGGISQLALRPEARALLGDARKAYGAELPIPAVAGFTGGWTLFHGVLARLRGGVTADAIREAALQLDEPMYSSINGGGVRFAPAGDREPGQNARAPAVVAQWQQVEEMRTVWPAPFAEARPLL